MNLKKKIRQSKAWLQEFEDVLCELEKELFLKERESKICKIKIDAVWSMIESLVKEIEELSLVEDQKITTEFPSLNPESDIVDRIVLRMKSKSKNLKH